MQSGQSACYFLLVVYGCVGEGRMELARLPNNRGEGMAVLTETKHVIIRPWEKLNIRTGFGIDLDNGDYSVSSLGLA